MQALVLARAGRMRQAGETWQRPTELAKQTEKRETAGIYESAEAVCYARLRKRGRGQKARSRCDRAFQRPIDILLERWDRRAVALELDVFWVSVGGNDPVEMLKQNAGRVPLVHLKDKAKGAPVQYTEGVPPQTFKKVGAGVLDFPAILKAAATAGVKHYFVEQDQTPGDSVASLRQSYNYLRKI